MDHNEIKAIIDSMTGETKAAFSALKAQHDELKTANGNMQRQLDAIDAAGQGRLITAPETKSLGQMITEHPAFQERKANGFAGRQPLTMTFNLERKTNITDATMGTQTTGTIPLVRLPGVPALPRQALRIRDVMRKATVDIGSAFDYAKQSTRSNATSPQVEATTMAESTYLWNSASDFFRTIAHFTNVSRQALSDVPWLRAQLDSELIYGLNIKEEAEILSGAGTGVHLNGIITQATAFDTATYNTGSWQRIDQLRKAKLQARLAGLASYAPSAYVLHPGDMEALELTKDSYGRYLIGDPQGGPGIEIKTIWGLPVVESDSITPGTFLVGPFDTGAILLDRQSVTVEISFEHASNFTANLATILCEERVGLAVQVPSAFVTGSFSQSPA